MKTLKEWKRRFVRFVGERDPQLHPIPVILKDLETAKGKKRSAAVVESINSWVAQKLYAWEKAKGRTRIWIDLEIFGVLRLFDFQDAAIKDILDTASTRIARRQDPFPQWKKSASAYYPVTPDKLKNIHRTWRKRSTPLA